jgi:CMP-N-acetylneuraminate monooxygenase
VREKLATVDLSGLEPGVHFVDRRRFVLHLASDGKVRAAHNRCRHQGGRFQLESGCSVRCPWHGWALDVARMTYTNPAGDAPHPELEVERHGSVITLWETLPAAPWHADPRAQAPLAAGELCVTYLAHACVAIEAGGFVLCTDPWLEGPAFTRGWWLAHEPPPGALERVARADLVYISHNHSDHLNPTTLERLVELAPELPVIVPDFEGGGCERRVRQLGLRNVRAVPFDHWLQLGPELRVMILRDGTAAGDSGLLLEYKGHTVLNAVDCSDLNGGPLPDGVDLFMSSFSRGATGFPVCWGELMAPEAIRAWIAKDRGSVLHRVSEAVQRCAPRAYLAFASFFTEAHPADEEIRRVNEKISAEEVCGALSRSSPETFTWNPWPGDRLDLEKLALARGQPPREPDWDFERFLAPLEACRSFSPLGDAAGILHYFEWAGFRADLILHIIETDDRFSPCGMEWLVDLSGPRLLARRPTTAHRYLRLKVRGDVFRHTLRHGLPWDEISIGFNARMYREPNVYNRDFWSHFQNDLPAQPPFPR